MNNKRQFHQYLAEIIEYHPEIFPPEIKKGYILHGSFKSQKMGVPIRRIRVKATGEVYQLRPSIFMPYLVGKTDEVEKALYLRRFGVPYEALAYVFGRDAMYWYRLTAGLGRFSVVGTTVKDVAVLPEHLVADEKHSWLRGKRVYLPTTVAHNCFLGVNVVEQACF